MGGNSSSEVKNIIEYKSLEEFQNATPRKITLHILSKNIEDCSSFVQKLSNKRIRNGKAELLEKNIIKKDSLYSFMNYRIYNEPEMIIQNIKSKCEIISKDPKNKNVLYSEVIIILDNENINKHVEILKDKILNDYIFDEPCYTPFLIFLSPSILNLEGFMPSKTFQYKFSLQDILNFNIKVQNEDNIKENENIDINPEIQSFFRKLHVLFSYYNELGDIFSFVNSEGKKVNIRNEDDTNIAVFINILLMGRTGAGKSTCLNLILDEKKSIEGGTGLSTTSKNILIYQKTDIPLRFYDVKGIEDEKTIENYLKILSKYYGETVSSKDSINAIFYCMEFKNGTVIERLEERIYEKLIEFKIPIIFIITKCPFNPYKNSGIEKIEKDKKRKCNRIESVIKSVFRDNFKKNNKENEAESFINYFIKFNYVNFLGEDYLNLPPFGMDKLLDFFIKAVPKNEWEKLKYYCEINDEENCRHLCENNFYLKSYSEFEIINERNKNEALNYLKRLKAGAFFSGWLPLGDIGFEYLYRYLFKNKLKNLYGFDYEEANQSLVEEENKKAKLNQEDINNKTNNINQNETQIEEQIDQDVNNKGRNAGASIRGAGEVAGIVIKALPTAGQTVLETTTVVSKVTTTVISTGTHIGFEIGSTGTKIGIEVASTTSKVVTETASTVTKVAVKTGISSGLKIASWVMLPVTCIAFGIWSCVNVHKDCHKILDIFDKAFTPLRFKTLLNYIESYLKAIKYLEEISKKFGINIIDD